MNNLNLLILIFFFKLILILSSSNNILFPNLYFSGFSKCGTTSLIHLLNEHPLIIDIGDDSLHIGIESHIFDENLLYDDINKIIIRRINNKINNKKYYYDIPKKGIIIHYTPNFGGLDNIQDIIINYHQRVTNSKTFPKFLFMLRNPIIRSASSWWFKNDCYKEFAICPYFQKEMLIGMEAVHKLAKCYHSHGVKLEEFIESLVTGNKELTFKQHEVLNLCPLSLMIPSGQTIYSTHVGKSIYIYQLLHWYSRIPSSHIYIMLLENYVKDPVREVELLFNWLGLDLYGTKGYKNPQHLYNLTRTKYNSYPIPKKVLKKEVYPLTANLTTFFEPFNRNLEKFYYLLNYYENEKKDEKINHPNFQGDWNNFTQEILSYHLLQNQTSHKPNGNNKNNNNNINNINIPTYYPQSSILPYEDEPRYTANSSSASSESHYSRHARRLYVGGIPTSHTNEEQLKYFLNEVISKCLGEENLNSYILSIYINQKKCFAFIELSSIELTTCCLELDGIIYMSSILKIQRANEYKPELVANLSRNPIRFNANKAPFPHNTPISETQIITPLDRQTNQHCIRMGSIVDVTPGCVVLIGFPHDEGAKRSGITAGSASAPVAIRFYLRKLLSSPTNPEFGIDLSRIPILDVGDVPVGLTLEDALSRLDDSITEILNRGVVPIVIGGSGDLAYACASGLMTSSGVPIAVVDINSTLNMDPLVRLILSSFIILLFLLLFLFFL